MSKTHKIMELTFKCGNRHKQAISQIIDYIFRGATKEKPRRPDQVGKEDVQ